MQELENIWNATPKELRNSNKYCFYVSDSYKDVPKRYRSRKVIVSIEVPKGCIYYAPKGLLKIILK